MVISMVSEILGHVCKRSWRFGILRWSTGLEHACVFGKARDEVFSKENE